jgi:hypothetical protein
MKSIKNISKTVFFLFSFFFFLNTNAQSPQKMSYQAVIRNASNNLIANSTVGMQISILQGSSSGTIVYSETQTPTTNINGLATLEIGTGSVVSGTFATINWANGPYFIKTETDPSGGTSYSIVGTSEFLSVPYALYSLNSGLKYLGKLQTDVGSSGTPMINNNTLTTLTWFTPFIDYASSLSTDGQTITIPSGVSKIRITSRVSFQMFNLNASTVHHKANVAITLNGNNYGWSSERISTNQDFLLFNGWNFSSPLLDVMAGDTIQMKVYQNNGVDYGLGWGSINNTFLVVEYYQ